MRLLILSEAINTKQRDTRYRHNPPYDVDLVTGDANETEKFEFSLFDFDVSIVHIAGSWHRSVGYYNSLPKIARDATLALESGRTVICMPQSENFQSIRGDVGGQQAYDWVKRLGVEMQDSAGSNIRPLGLGKAQVVTDYLTHAPGYYQVIPKPKPDTDRTLAVVADTDIVVGLEHQYSKGTFVVLPPPIVKADNYPLVMIRGIDLAKRYHERAQRRIPLTDAPPWIDRYRIARARDLETEIEKLSNEKSKYDRLAYVLYGTGEELEDSVALLLDELGLAVERQPQGSNIDMKARHAGLRVGFAFEVTGLKDKVRKDSPKVPQAWQFLNDRVGTPEENDRLVVVANTQYHLDPRERARDAFTPEVERLLGGNGVLLITTVQLYELWRAVHEGRAQADEVVQKLYSNPGPFLNWP